MITKAAREPWRLPGDLDAPSFRPNPAHARKEIPQSVLDEAQNLFETTDIPLLEIARRVGLHRSLLHRTVLRKGWSRPEPQTQRALVTQRLRARIEKELCSIEVSLAHSRSKEGREAARQSADTLTSLMRTLRELKRYDEEMEAARLAEEPEEDIDAMRMDFCHKLEGLRVRFAERRERAAEEELATRWGQGGA